MNAHLKSLQLHQHLVRKITEAKNGIMCKRLEQNHIKVHGISIQSAA